jgi:hypothetical protein
MNVVLQVYRYYFTCNTYTCVPGTGVRVYMYLYIYINLFQKPKILYIFFATTTTTTFDNRCTTARDHFGRGVKIDQNQHEPQFFFLGRFCPNWTINDDDKFQCLSSSPLKLYVHQWIVF